MQRECNSSPAEDQEKYPSFGEVLAAVLRTGACRMLQVVIEVEVDDFIRRYQDCKDENGHRLVVRNGSMPERYILSGIGKIEVQQPRVDDRKLRQ